MIHEERTMKSYKAFDGKILSVRVDTIELPGQRYSKREIVERSGAIATVAVTGDGQLVLVSQYRKAAERTLLEIPAGMLEPGENPIDGAIRELEEETGFLAEKVEFMTEIFSTPGFCTETIHLFFASRLKETEQNLDETEDVEVVLLSPEEALKKILLGEIIDAKTIAGILMYEKFFREVNHE